MTSPTQAAEIRKEATALECRWSHVLGDGLYFDFVDWAECIGVLSDDEQRTFLLLVACALEG